MSESWMGNSRVVTLTDTGVPSLFWTKAVTCTSYWAPGSSRFKSTAVTSPATIWLCSSLPTAAKLEQWKMWLREIPQKHLSHKPHKSGTVNGPAKDYRLFSSKIYDKLSLPAHWPMWLGQPLQGFPGLEETSQSQPQIDLMLKVKTQSINQVYHFVSPNSKSSFSRRQKQ